MTANLITDPSLLRETAKAMTAFRRKHGRYPFDRELAELLGLSKRQAGNRMGSAAAAGLVNWRPQRGKGERRPVLRPDGPLRQLTVAEVRMIRARWAAGWRQVDLARRYDVTVANVSYIVNRRTWRHVA